jgi:two-component system, NarL family, sensor histidine kinase DesK
VTPSVIDVPDPPRRWATGWRRVVFPGIFCFYLGQTVHGVAVHSRGWVAVAGYVVLAAFAVAYVRALTGVMDRRRAFMWAFAAMVALLVLELPIAHQDAFVMSTFIVAVSLAAWGRRAVPIVAALVLAAVFVPPLVPSWDASVDVDAAVTTALVGVALYGFFEIVRANRELTVARAEVAHLAAEGERSRIARDLHDRLGHSLTTITVKAGLARRLADTDPDRAAREIGEVEELARRALADVRNAVTGYRDVSLTGELAAGRELLRVVGIEGDLPGSTDGVRDDLHELFGWVVREGLTNVVRHANASHCTVTLTRDTIEIVDDGLATRPSSGGSGLRGLQERVESAGGTMTAGPAGAVGRVGWRLRVEVPARMPAAAPGPVGRHA